MVASLALLGAVFYGIGDFLGGRATQKTSVIPILATSHLIGLFAVAVAAPIMATRFDGSDFFLGVAASGFGLFGLALFYQALARGPMVVAAPVTAVTCAVLPFFWGLGFGEKLSRWQIIGVFIGLVSIFLVSSVTSRRKIDFLPRVLVEALLAGIGFAAFYIVINQTEAATAPWPIVGSRLLSVIVTLAIGGFLSYSIWPPPGARLLALGLGVFDTAANVVVLAALNRGMLSLVTVLVSFHPAITVLLARVVLNERITSRQLLGLGGAIIAISLIVVG